MKFLGYNVAIVVQQLQFTDNISPGDGTNPNKTGIMMLISYLQECRKTFVFRVYFSISCFFMN